MFNPELPWAGERESEAIEEENRGELAAYRAVTKRATEADTSAPEAA
jgi:hypothetical protein